MKSIGISDGEESLSV